MSGAYDRAMPAPAPQQAPREAPQPTPGKRALTDRLTRAPGQPSALERAQARWMPVELRYQQEEELQARLFIAHVNFKDAIASKRLELLLTKSSNWGFVAELVFGLISYNAVGAVVGAAARVRKRAIRAINEATIRNAYGGDAAVAAFHTIAERINPDVVKDTLAHLGRASRSGVKERSKSLAPHASSKVAFLSVLSNGVDQHTLALHQSMRHLSDDDLILLTEAYDAEYHALDVYLRAVDDLLARYESQAIEEVGETRGGATTTRGRNAETALPRRLEAVRFVYRERERVALVERTILPAEQEDGGKAPPVDAYSLGRCTWSHWTDEDLSSAAAGVYEHRVGSPMTINVEAGEIPPTWAPMVSTWIATVAP